jgi:hypothetical protein
MNLLDEWRSWDTLEQLKVNIAELKIMVILLMQINQNKTVQIKSESEHTDLYNKSKCSRY